MILFIIIIIQMPRVSFTFQATCDRSWCGAKISFHNTSNERDVDLAHPKQIRRFQISSVVIWAQPAGSCLLKSRRIPINSAHKGAGLNFSDNQLVPRSDTFGSQRELFLSLVESPLIPHFNVNIAHFQTQKHETRRWYVWCVSPPPLFAALSGTNIILLKTAARMARISAKHHNPLVATKHPLLWDLFNNSTNLLDLTYISVALGRILEVFELLLLCFWNHLRDIRCHGNFCDFHCNVFRQESSALSVFMKAEKHAWIFHVTWKSLSGAVLLISCAGWAWPTEMEPISPQTTRQTRPSPNLDSVPGPLMGFSPD